MNENTTGSGTPIVDSPTPIAAGTYAVYDAPDGGYVLVATTDDGTVHRRHIPGRIVRTVAKLIGGKLPLGGSHGLDQ